MIKLIFLSHKKKVGGDMNRDDYKRYIVEMLKQINNIKYLKIIYEIVMKYFTRS